MKGVTIGGERLGSGAKNIASRRHFERSTHDLSFKWRSSMACGTLVPFMNEVCLIGDSWDIDLFTEVVTLPTLGPLFGSFKVQLDVFYIPARLYIASLHMNRLGIGNNMADVPLPLMEVRAVRDSVFNDGIQDNRQINPSSLLKYLGLSGIGRMLPAQVANVGARNFNALGLIGYWDTIKNYYANKQEDNAYIVHKRVKATTWTITTATHVDGDDNFSALPVGSSSPVNIEPFAGSVVRIVPTRPAGQPVDPERITVDASTDGVGYNTVFLSNIYQSYTDNGTVIVYSNPVGSPVYTHFDNVDIDTSISVDLDKEPDLVAFPLENIDTMRENILKHFSTAAYEIDDTAISPYGLPLEVDAGFTVSSKEFPMEGLLVKTYGSDLFHNWINTEWIDGAQGIAARTAVDTTGDNFTIDSLNLARKIYDLLNRIAVSGGSGDDWQEAVFDHERKGSIEKPVFLGGLSQAIAFQEIVSTAEANDPLGTLAGRGTTMGDQKGGRISVNVHEPSYLIGIVSITPRVDYSQGNDWDVNLESQKITSNNPESKHVIDVVTFS